MRFYTVTKSEPNTDREFQAYIDLLQEIGVDISHAPRTPEPGATNRWLYVWKSQPLAQRFARELANRLRQPSWRVHEFDAPEDDSEHDIRGPLAPLTILSIPTDDGIEFQLERSSQERILSHFPNASIASPLFVPTDIRVDLHERYGEIWDRISTTLTGISEEEITGLGGVRIINTDRAVLYKDLPTDTALYGRAS